MALLRTMYYGSPNVLRLSFLKLDGFRVGAAVLFCPNCDFQTTRESASVPICPVCDTSLHVTCVTPDLVERVQRQAA